MKKITILMGLTMVLLSGLLLVIALNYEKSVAKYNALEEDLVEAAQAYVKMELKNDITGSVEIDTYDLLEKKYIKEDILMVEGDKCSGRVIVTNKPLGNLDYEAKIKCDGYKTGE